MTRVILLDSEPLGRLVHPRFRVVMNEWAVALVAADHEVVVPEIIYYELRRELLRIGNALAVARLDAILDRFFYAPVSKAIFVRATELWAETRNRGLPTADDKALDIDVILAASAEAFMARGDEVVVATSNVRHLDRFVPARLWDEITP